MITEKGIKNLEDILLCFGEAHNMLAKTSLSKEEYQPISGLLAKAKVELFNFCNDHKAALQNKVSEKCKHKSLADTGAGYYYCPDCDYREKWKVFSHTSALGNTGDYMSDCGIENGTISFYCDKPDDITNEELQEICDSLNSSIVNERKDESDSLLEKDNDIIVVGKCANCGVEYHIHQEEYIPPDFKQLTGHNSPEEMVAYEKGREDEQKVISEWIEQWDGSSNSAMGTLLKKKFDEKKDNVGVWVNVGDRLPDAKINGDKILLFRDTNESQKGLSISVFNTIFVKYCEPSSYWMPLPAPPESQPQQKEVDEDEMPPL